MDDFSWGETRKVEGAIGDDHSKTEGIFDASYIFMKRWHEFEIERIKKAERFLPKRRRRGTEESEEIIESDQTDTEKERD